MAQKTLKEHYERKYAHESDVSSIESIKMVGVPVNRLEAAVKFLPQFFKEGTILEIGAGNGSIAKTFLESDMKISSYAVGDLSLSRVEGIRKRLKDSRMSVLELDAEAISENEYGKYDAIIMIALIEHLVDPLHAMQSIRKLLKPGGFVYIDTPNVAKYTRRLKLLFGRFPSTSSRNEGLTTYSGKPVDLHEEGHLHYFTFRSLSLMLTQRCGFSRVVKFGYPCGNTPLGKATHNWLSKIWPEMFSELAVIAYA